MDGFSGDGTRDFSPSRTCTPPLSTASTSSPTRRASIRAQAPSMVPRSALRDSTSTRSRRAGPIWRHTRTTCSRAVKMEAMPAPWASLPLNPTAVIEPWGLLAARNSNGGGTIPGRDGGRSEPLASSHVHRAPKPPVAPSGRDMSLVPPRSGSRAAVRGGGRRGEDEDDGADNGVEKIFQSAQNKSDKANWSEYNNKLLCKLLVEQIALGNYNKGTMTARGYKLIIEKYHCATNLKHDRKHISNRIRQLKQMFQFIKDLRNISGLGRDENGWPTADHQWWEDATEKHPDWKKLRWGPPEYLPELEQIFEGLAVDGSTSYVAGQSNIDDHRAPMEHEDEDNGFEDMEAPMEHSPMSSNSRKRESSTSTTAESPSKKSKSPMVRMMKDYISFSSKNAAERNEYLKAAYTAKQQRKS